MERKRARRAMMGTVTARTIAQLWRYPVKSMGGERLPAVGIDTRAMHADRLWAVRDLELDAVTTARRLPMLLGCSARFVDDPPDDVGPGNVTDVVVTLPDGTEVGSTDRERMDARLSELNGKSVALVPLPPMSDRSAYRGVLANKRDLRRQFALADDEPMVDLSMLPVRKLAELAIFATPVGIFADAYPLHILTTASLNALAERAPHADFDVRRFRPNVVIDTGDASGFVEEQWLGGVLTTPDAGIRAVCPTVRCSVPLREQRQFDLDPDPDVVRTISRHADRCLGVYADIEEPGVLREGDEVTFTPSTSNSAVHRLANRIKRSAVRSVNRVLP